MEDEDESDDDAKDQRKLPCDACIASGRDCTYGLLEVDWQGRKRCVVSINRACRVDN